MIFQTQGSNPHLLPWQAGSSWATRKHPLESHKLLTDKIRNAPCLAHSLHPSRGYCQITPTVSQEVSGWYSHPYESEILKFFGETSLSKIKPQRRKADDDKWGNTPGSIWTTAIKLPYLGGFFLKNINLPVVRVILSIKITTYPNIQHILVIKSTICHQKGLLLSEFIPPMNLPGHFKRETGFNDSLNTGCQPFNCITNSQSWKTDPSSLLLYCVTTHLPPTIPRVKINMLLFY